MNKSFAQNFLTTAIIAASVSYAPTYLSAERYSEDCDLSE